MRVVVSGARTDVTSCVVEELARRGHEVVDSAQGPADALVHIGEPRDTAVAGRAVVISSVLDDAPPGALLIRTPDVLGRATIGADRFAGPVVTGIAGRPNLVQFIHHDDLARFAADALDHPQWVGRVDLAADDAVPLHEMAAIMGKPYIELNPLLHRLIRQPAPPDRLLDTTRLGELGFAPAWTGRDCVIDFHRANREYLHLGSRRLTVPWRFPWIPVPQPPSADRDEPQRYPANDGGDGGEFDTTVNPRWPEFTCANIAEAFPGPMTPLSLELAMEAMRATGVLAADIVQMKGDIRRAVTEEHVGCFGHTIYVNLTVSRAASAMLPAAGPSAWRDLLFGAGAGADAAGSDTIGLLHMAARLPKIAALLSTAAAETRRIDAEARDLQRDAAYYRDHTDEQLHSQLHCARDEVASSWAVAALGSAGVVPIMALIERFGGKRLASQFKGGVEHLASAGLIRGTYDLAHHAAADPAVMAALRDNDAEAALRELPITQPEFAARVDAVVAEYGHRGPNETELSSPVFADTPARLLDAVAKLADSHELRMTSLPEMNAGLRLLAQLGAGFQQSRERARDAAVRYTHNYRLIAREVGARLADRGVIADPADVFYLVRDELIRPPADMRARVSRRRAERIRLTHVRPPVHFTGRWEPRRDTPGELRPGESVTGIAASAGLAKGRVRVLTADSIDELQAGEVLVAECTDTGWTPFFSYAAAVVVDTGAEMSHAAVIAREFGIPCVVGSVAASRILRTGQVVEVDGSTGRVTRVE